MAGDVRSHVCLIHLEFYFPDAQSLKDKRMSLRRLKDRLHARFNVSVAEVGYQDLWQRAVVAVASVSGDRPYLEGLSQQITREVEELFPSLLTHFDVEYW